MAFFRAAISGGGGNGFPYTVQGTLPDFTTANQEQSVDTGLSNITYFYVEGYPVNYQTTMVARAWLDTTKSFAKQVATNGNNAGSATAVTSGADATGVITGAGVQIKASGISGGTVTVKTGNNAAYVHKNVKWYAG